MGTKEMVNRLESALEGMDWGECISNPQNQRDGNLAFAYCDVLAVLVCLKAKLASARVASRKTSRKYAVSEHGMAVNEAYNQSEKGKARKHRYYLKTKVKRLGETVNSR